MARYLAEKGLNVLKNGYNVIPIQPGQKFPTIEHWQRLVTTPADIKKWLANGHANAGVGITAAKTPMVDIDVLHEPTAAEMRRIVQGIAGEGMLRVGNYPKLGMIYQATTPFKKMSSRIYSDPDGKKAQIEILGDGEQFVAYHIHPDTKKPYFWLDFAEPEDFPADQLPVLTANHGQQIIDAFHKLCEDAGWVRRANPRQQLATVSSRVQGSSSRPIPSPSTAVLDDDDELSDDWTYTSEPIGLEHEELRGRLLSLENDERFDDREAWWPIGMAVWHETQGSEDGWELWNEWSEDHRTYNEALTRKAWDSFGKYDNDRRPITARYLIQITPEYTAQKSTIRSEEAIKRFDGAQNIQEINEICTDCKKVEFLKLDFEMLLGKLKAAYKRVTGLTMLAKTARDLISYEPNRTEMPEWLVGWVYLTHTDYFFNMKTKDHYNRTAFDSVFGRNLPDGTIVSPSEFALNKMEIPIFYMTGYLPTQDRSYKLNGHKYANSYSTVNVPKIPVELTRRDRNNVKYVENHFKHLFPNDDRGRELLISWLAYIAQTKARPNWAVVVQGVEGDGKTLIGALMATVLGGDNVRTVNAQTLESPFNAWAEGQLFIFIEELRMLGHNRHDILNRIKPNITNDTIEIHPKHVNPYDVLNTSAYMASTNFQNALPINDNDSRYFIMMSQWQDTESMKQFIEQNPTYYARLHDALSQSPGALRQWLENYELHPEFDAKRRAPPSEGHDYMVQINKSETTMDVEDIIKSGKHQDVCADLLIVSRLNEILSDENGITIAGETIRRNLLDLGFRYMGRIRINGVLESTWTKNPNKWSRIPEKLRSEVRKYLDSVI